MSLKSKLAKSAKRAVAAKKAEVPAPKKAAPPRKPKPPKLPERRSAKRSEEVLALFRRDGSVVPGAEWVIAGQGIAHPLGSIDEVLKDAPRTRDGLREYFSATSLKGILFDNGPGKPVGVLREDLGL